jgi:hypothetical protein
MALVSADSAALDERHRSCRWLSRMRYPHVPIALLSCLLAGCSNDPAAGDQVTQTIVYLRQDDAPVVKIEYIDRSLALARLKEEAFTRSESIAGGIGTATSALSTSGCNAASLRLFDTLVGESMENQVCFVGTGTVNLATIPRGSNGNWAGAVKNIRPSFTQVGTGNVGGLLSPSSCTTYDCPSHHFTQNLCG